MRAPCWFTTREAIAAGNGQVKFGGLLICPLTLPHPRQQQPNWITRETLAGDLDGDIPSGMPLHGLFELCHRHGGGVILIRRVGIVPTEGKNVPVIAANTMTEMKREGSFRVFFPTRQAVMTGPPVANVAIGQSAHNGLLIAECQTQSIDLASEEVDIASPAK